VLGLKEPWSHSTFSPANSGSALTLAESHLSESGRHLQLSARVPVYIQAISNFTWSTHPASIGTCSAALATLNGGSAMQQRQMIAKQLPHRVSISEETPAKTGPRHIWKLTQHLNLAI